jgi:hypothetical protein
VAQPLDFAPRKTRKSDTTSVQSQRVSVECAVSGHSTPHLAPVLGVVSKLRVSSAGTRR